MRDYTPAVVADISGIDRATVACAEWIGRSPRFPFRSGVGITSPAPAALRTARINLYPGYRQDRPRRMWAVFLTG